MRELALHDWIVFLYLLGLNVAAWRAPAHPDRATSIEQVFGLLVVLLATLVLVRGGLIKGGFWAPLLYRVAIYGTVQLSYFLFGRFLPVVNPNTLDFELYSLDMLLFGVEPAVYMDRFVNAVTTEWFSFFYFSYFFILALHVIPVLFFVKHARLLGEFALGMLIVFCVGHTVYMLVPGYGPYRAIADTFQNPFPAGMWLDTVMATVAQGGAQKDIFPSLHTAAPTFIALYSFRHRDKLPFRYSWPFVAFFAVNIVIATMFLRWHWVIDVVAGLLLAATASWLSMRLTDRELSRREAHGLSPNWPGFFSERSGGPQTRLQPRLPRPV
jgi:hypothetical protein